MILIELLLRFVTVARQQMYTLHFYDYENTISKGQISYVTCENSKDYIYVYKNVTLQVIFTVSIVVFSIRLTLMLERKEEIDRTSFTIK